MEDDWHELRRAARHWFAERDPARKAAGVRELASNWKTGALALDCQAVLAPELPGIPDKPERVAPGQVLHRSMKTVEGRAILIHALVHIEFNAINLALDAIWRFSGMPNEFYTDWLQVADEEALHFSLLADHLRGMGYDYGDFPAHGSLWEMAEKTGGDVLARMALVPRTLEARGLDAVPVLRDKFVQAGDKAVVAILDIILKDEIGHVAIGNRWYGHLCSKLGLEPLATYSELALQHKAPVLRGPFNLHARRAAGFTEAELCSLGMQ